MPFDHEQLKALAATLAGKLDREQPGLQYCIMLVGERDDGHSDTSLLSNIREEDLREHFLTVMDAQSSLVGRAH